MQIRNDPKWRINFFVLLMTILCILDAKLKKTPESLKWIP